MKMVININDIENFIVKGGTSRLKLIRINEHQFKAFCADSEDEVCIRCGERLSATVSVDHSKCRSVIYSNQEAINTILDLFAEEDNIICINAGLEDQAFIKS